LKPDRFDLQTA